MTGLAVSVRVTGIHVAEARAFGLKGEVLLTGRGVDIALLAGAAGVTV